MINKSKSPTQMNKESRRALCKLLYIWRIPSDLNLKIKIYTDEKRN